MATFEDPRLKLLSNYQRRALTKCKRLLGVASLNPDLIFDLAESNPSLVPHIIHNMTDQVVRGEVILEYTTIDNELDHVLYHHFFGKTPKAIGRIRQSKTLELMLQNLYILQKLAIVRSFREVPKAIASTIAAVNDLRNGLAHNLYLEHLSPSKRTYKGHIFTAEGLDAFRKDTLAVGEFLNPELHRLMRKFSFVQKWIQEGVEK